MSCERIERLLKQRGLKPATFAREIGIPASTIYSITRGQTKMDNIGIGIFMKIAHGLGMTAEELYYGNPPGSPSYSDPRQEELNGHFESLNEQSKTDLLGFAKSYAADPERRMSKERESDNAQAAMGA